jgi:branched-chain amino acid transport system ATP-binding protein
MQETILELKNVSVHYGGVTALDSVDVALHRGEILALMGPNGAGKSTALKALFGLAPLTQGHVEFLGETMKPVPHKLVQAGVVFVPQGRRVFPSLSVKENLELGALVTASREVARSRLDEIFSLFPALKVKVSASAGLLSGGQQQMVAIGRGLMSKPEVLLLDEPTLGLAPKIVKEVFSIIAEINQRFGTSIIVVEHNVRSLLDIAHRGYVLDKGKVVAQGTAEHLKQTQVMQKVFLGQLE